VEDLTKFQNSLLKYFVDNKSGAFTKVISQGLSYNFEDLGVDISVMYKRIIESQVQLNQLRPYVFKILQKLVKAKEATSRYCPQIAQEVMENLAAECANSWRRTIKDLRKTFKQEDLVQVWTEIEFFKEVMGDSLAVQSCFDRILKVAARKKGAKDLEFKDLFSQKLAQKKDELIFAYRSKTRLIYESLG